MALTNDEKKLIRAQVAAYLGDIKNVKCVQDAKPDAQEYFAFIATRLVKKLRLDTGKVEGDPVATKAEPKPEPKPEAKPAADKRKPAVRTKAPVSQAA
jgi:hypothetical protein